MVISFDAAKVQQLFEICKYFYNYFYFYGDFIIFTYQIKHFCHFFVFSYNYYNCIFEKRYKVS